MIKDLVDSTARPEIVGVVNWTAELTQKMGDR